MKSLLSATLFVAAMLLTDPIAASEMGYLNGLNGAYSGTGTVRLRTNSKPIRVKCRLEANSGPASLSLKGRCTGLLIISKSISADVKAAGSRYRGTYVGAGTGLAQLSGTRRGNSLFLAVRWANNVNGDRDALLTVRKTSRNGLTITTSDRDPGSDKIVTTSEIVLERR